MPILDRIRVRRRQRGASLFEYMVALGLVAMVVLLGGRALYRLGDKSAAQADCIASDGGACGGDPAASAAYALAEAADRAELPSCPVTPPPPPRGFWERARDVAYGFVVDGAWGTVTGLWNAGRHPIATAQGLWTFGVAVVQHPGDVWNELNWTMYQAWQDNPERFVGSLVFELATFAVPPAKVSQVGKVKWVERTIRAVKTTKAARRVELASQGWRHVNVFPHGGTRVNCTRCVVAVDACLEGGAACALPMYDPLGNPTNSLPNAVGKVDLDELARRLGIPPQGWKRVADEAALAAEAASWGEGAKGIVAVEYTWQGQRYGHVFNVVVQNGAVSFLDGQTGVVYSVADLASNFPSGSWQVIQSRAMDPGVVVP
ncbi:MAG: toxin glutamine deamidase domain-containing protein [Polyangiaceae bacterium]